MVNNRPTRLALEAKFELQGVMQLLFGSDLPIINAVRFVDPVFMRRDRLEAMVAATPLAELKRRDELFSFGSSLCPGQGELRDAGYRYCCA